MWCNIYTFVQIRVENIHNMHTWKYKVYFSLFQHWISDTDTNVWGGSSILIMIQCVIIWSMHVRNVTSQFLMNTNMLVKTFIKWSYFFVSMVLSSKYRYNVHVNSLLMHLCYQNYLKTLDNILLQNLILLQVLALVFTYYFQTQVNTKISCTQLLMRNIFYLVNTTMCYTPKHQPVWQNDKRE